MCTKRRPVALHELIQPGCTGLIRIFVLIQPDCTGGYMVMMMVHITMAIPMAIAIAMTMRR